MIIGIFNVFKILSLKEFSTENFSINGMPVQPNAGTKLFTAGFFAFHYGFSHVTYAVFLSSLPAFFSPAASAPDSAAILLGGAAFFANHLFSFLHYRGQEKKKQNLGVIMYFPYARIFPMHLIIIFGFALNSLAALVFFMALKTIADVVMHVVQHQMEGQ